jgi:hypothetical protein
MVGAGAAIAGPALLAGTASASTAASSKATPQLLTRNNYPSGSFLAPFGRHIAYGADPTSQIAVAWQVAAPVGKPFVRVGPSPTDLGQPIYAEVRNLATPASIWNTSTSDPLDSITPSLASATIEQYYLHATIEGLRADTTYYYSVGHDGWDFPGDVSSLGSFTTGSSARQPFTFTAFGDQGVSYDAVGTSTLVRTQNPAFHLHAGDISYAENGGDGLLTDPYDPRAWDSFFTEIEPAAGAIPWQVAIGNHEMETWYSPDGYGGQYTRFDFPGESSSATPPVYYSWTYGNVAFLSLDANDVSYEIPANLGYSGGKQVAWLASTLAALRKDPSIDFIVAYFHHCAYSTCTTHGSEGGVRQYFVPLFDQYSVDLVINGHNHIYERTAPLRGGAVVGSTPIGSTWQSANGTTYAVAGGAGKSLYSFSAPDSYEGDIDNVSSVASYINEPGGTTQDETVTWSQVRYTGYCLLVVESVPSSTPGKGTSTLKVRGLDEAGQELDSITLVR